MSGDILIMVAPTGARRTKADHPALPVTPQEIADAAAHCCEAGAAMIHLHVRDRDGRHSLAADSYRAAIDAVRRAVGTNMVIQATSEAVGRFSPAEQMAAIKDVRPESASLAVRELIPDAAAEPEAARFLAWMAKEYIAPQYILYTPEEVGRFAELRRRGVISGRRPFVLYVLGRYSTDQESSPADLLPFLQAQEDDCIWCVCAFGARESACALMAGALGGHVRVGFENNLRLANGDLAPSNAALVDQIARGAALLGRPPMIADRVRELLDIRL